MQAKKYTSTNPRRILTAMVTGTSVCSRIASQWPPEGLFRSSWENLIAGWCVKHLKKYGQAPGRSVEGYFDDWAEKRKEDKTVRLVERFLSVLSDEHERSVEGLSSDYVLDLAGKHFNKVRLQREIESAEMELDGNRVDEAMDRLVGIPRVELGIGSVTKLGEDFDAWRDAFDDEQNEALIVYPNPLGGFFRREFCRDAFVAFTGAFGRGKSWWLLDLAYRAVKQKRRVAFYETGDMSRRQVMRRFGQRATRRPKRSGSFEVPVSFADAESGPEKEWRKIEGITPQAAFKAWKSVQAGKDRIRLSVHPSGSLTAEQLASHLESWEREGWVADVVLVDYVDLLAPAKGTNEKRDQINETWMRLRRLSQELHCCVVTATQGDANSYAADLIRPKNFSDSRTKNDHVTAMIGLNVNDVDKARGVVRLNWLKRRDEAYTETQQVHVAGCLEIGCPAVKACKA